MMLRVVRGLLGTGPLDTLESTSPSAPEGRFGIEIASTQEIDVESMSNLLNRCPIDP